MAPPDRQPNPGHPAAAGLDGEFGHEGEIAAWVEWLLHPEQHIHDRMIILSGGNKVEHTSNLSKPKPPLDPNGPLIPDPPQPTEYYPYESVIQGCFVEQFFDPAQALSGQLFDDDSDVGKVYRALDEAFWRNDDWNGRLTGGFDDLREKWQSPSTGNAGEFLGSIDDFMRDFTVIAKELAAIPIAYGGIIRVARANQNEAMGRLVDAFHTKFYARESPWHKVLIGALSAASAAALTYVTGGAAAAAFGAGLNEVIDKALAGSDGDANVGGGTWREIVDNYFVAQMKILEHARGEIEKLEQVAARLIGRLETMPMLRVDG